MAYAVPLPEGSFKSVMRVLLALIIVFRTLTIPHLFILLHRCAPDYSATAPDFLWGRLAKKTFCEELLQPTLAEPTFC